MKFNRDKQIVFLDPHTELQVGDAKLHIILSPSLYWVKRVSLPVKYVREVKKLLPSLFEDLLPEGNYSYTAYKDSKEDGFFYIFAYEDKVILDLLAQQGVASSSIASIHFAQSELASMEGAVKINEEQSIYVKDGIVTLVPCCWLEESGALDLSEVKLSKHKVTLAQFGHIVDTSSLIKVGAILTMFIVLSWVELFIVHKDIAQIEQESSSLFQKYKLKPTRFQNEAILKKYRTIHQQQTKLRLGMERELKKKNIQKITYKNGQLKVSS